MKIGIYKPFKKIYFGELPADETAAWSYEVVALVRLMQKLGHDVCLLSPCDDASLDKSTEFYNFDQPLAGSLDRIIIVGGSFALDKFDITQLMTKCRAWANRVDLLITDQKLIPDFIKVPENRYDHIYTQGLFLKDGSHHINTIRSFTEELIVFYRHNVKPALSAKNKYYDFYFGGGERGRTKSFLEYVYRPNHLLFIKSTSLDIDNRVDFEQHTRFLRNARYTIIIADEEYNKSNFLIPRQYEAWMAQTIAFVENDYDNIKNLSIPKNSFLRVNSYLEMVQKTTTINADEKLKNEILEWQINQINADMIDGVNIKNALEL